MSAHAQTFRIQCPNLACQRILAVTEECRGRLVRCKGCSTLVRVPEAGTKVDAPHGASTPHRRAG